MKKTLLLFCSSTMLFSSCCDCDDALPSDEEIRTLIVGRWKSDDCGYPCNEGESSAAQSNHPINYNEFTFYSNGTVIGGPCVQDSCDTISLVPEYCTCSLQVENGTIKISSEGYPYPFWNHFPIPIYCIDDDILVLDNMVYNGATTHRVCFSRQ